MVCMHGKFVLFNLIGWHGGQPYDTHRRVGHRADRQYVKRPMVMEFAVRINLPWVCMAATCAVKIIFKFLTDNYIYYRFM